MPGLKKLFTKPKTSKQRQYEAVRAVEIDNLSVSDAAKKFNYTTASLYSIIRDVKLGKIIFFPECDIVTRKKRTPDYIRERIIYYRKQNLSGCEIKDKIINEGYKISVSTIERVLINTNIPKLRRRTNSERKLSKKQQHMPQRASSINFQKLKPFITDCPVAGVFFFIPHIIKSEIMDIITKCKMPKSSSIDSSQACLSMLLLKLIGHERLSHIDDYNHEPGLGLFAGLSVLPKSSYMSSYSCRSSEETLLNFQQQLMQHFQVKYPSFYESNFINLDFHSIPHYGTESQMEKVWCGAKHQAMKGANTIFAQDSESNAILYTRSDILRKNETKEIQNFVSYWKKVKKTPKVKETLVFDCKLSCYKILDELNDDGVQFITLRKRNKTLTKKTAKIENEKWSRVYLPIPKRKHKYCSVYESQVVLKKGLKPVRQIIVKDHGRAEPTYVITNNTSLKIKKILTVYAKRWRIENKLSELVSFFNLNALSSPIMIRIHFDILWTVIADTLYHSFAQDLPRFKNEKANTIFRRFINMPGKVLYDGNEFVIKIRKRAHTPILIGIESLSNGVKVPWLDNKLLRVEWTA